MPFNRDFHRFVRPDRAIPPIPRDARLTDGDTLDRRTLRRLVAEMID